MTSFTESEKAVLRENKSMMSNLRMEGERGDILALEFLRECGVDDLGSAAAAVHHGQIEVVKWYAKYRDWQDWQFAVLVKYAVEEGNIEMVKVLRDLGFPWDRNVLLAAVWGGKRQMAIWLMENRCPRANRRTLDQATARKPLMREALIKHRYL